MNFYVVDYWLLGCDVIVFCFLLIVFSEDVMLLFFIVFYNNYNEMFDNY